MTSHLRRLLLASLLLAPAAWATRVQVDTPLGSFRIDLLDDEAPNTVANFLNYVNDGDYDGSFLHRTVNGFVIQGGGFTLENGAPVPLATDPPIANEVGRSNLRGTIAMAKFSGDPDSATSQWFINLSDNTDLDTANGGFTVFGEVVGDDMAVVDGLVARSNIWNFSGVFGVAFGDLPLLGFEGTGDLGPENMLLTDITVLADEGFEVNAGVAGSWYDPATPGQGWFVDVIEGADGNLQLFVAWFTFEDRAPPADEDLSFGSDHHRWFTAIGPIDGNGATLDLFRNAGGRFNHPRAAPIERVGSFTMTFEDCTSAVISYDFEGGEGGSGEINAIRLSPDVFCGDIALR